jgi:hypothetical protein
MFSLQSLSRKIRRQRPVTLTMFWMLGDSLISLWCEEFSQPFGEFSQSAGKHINSFNRDMRSDPTKRLEHVTWNQGRGKSLTMDKGCHISDGIGFARVWRALGTNPFEKYLTVLCTQRVLSCGFVWHNYLPQNHILFSFPDFFGFDSWRTLPWLFLICGNLSFRGKVGVKPDWRGLFTEFSPENTWGVVAHWRTGKLFVFGKRLKGTWRVLQRMWEVGHILINSGTGWEIGEREVG